MKNDSVNSNAATYSIIAEWALNDFAPGYRGEDHFSYSIAPSLAYLFIYLHFLIPPHNWFEATDFRGMTPNGLFHLFHLVLLLPLLLSYVLCSPLFRYSLYLIRSAKTHSKLGTSHFMLSQTVSSAGPGSLSTFLISLTCTSPHSDAYKYCLIQLKYYWLMYYFKCSWLGFRFSFSFSFNAGSSLIYYVMNDLEIGCRLYWPKVSFWRLLELSVYYLNLLLNYYLSALITIN